MADRMNFFDKLMACSSSSSWLDAAHEWEIAYPWIGVEPDSQCAHCGKNISYGYIIRNIHTGRKVGLLCNDALGIFQSKTMYRDKRYWRQALEMALGDLAAHESDEGRRYFVSEDFLSFLEDKGAFDALENSHSTLSGVSSKLLEALKVRNEDD